MQKTDYSIVTERLSLDYKEKKVLEEISVSIPENKITAVMGPSGCGKTTFLRCLKKCREQYTIVVVTHNIAQAKRIADHVIFLYENRVLEERPAGEFFADPGHEETRAFLEGYLQ